MAEFGRLYTCSKCKEKVPSTHIRFDSDGRELICLGCYTSRHPPKQDPRMLKKHTPEFERKRGEKKGDYVSYQCNSCKYHFKIRIESQKAKRCPYCGKTDLRNISEESFSADDLVKDSSDLK